MLGNELSAEKLDELRKQFAEASELLDIKELTKSELDKIRFLGKRLIVVEVPIIMGLVNSWKLIDQLLLRGYTIKGIVEREKAHTSWVLLERAPSTREK